MGSRGVATTPLPMAAHADDVTVVS